MLDVMNRGYAEQHGAKFTSIVPCNVFGPHDNFNIQNGHVIPGILSRVLISLLPHILKFSDVANVSNINIILI